MPRPPARIRKAGDTSSGGGARGRSAIPAIPTSLADAGASRRLLGAHGTPERIVRHVVGVTLDPLIRSACRLARSGRLDEALRFSILDPAVGDGIFLRIALSRIAGAIARAAGVSETRLGRRVARRLSGIDVDAGSVARARAALPGVRMVVADALSDPFPLPVAGGYDAVIGNPPWGGWGRGMDPIAKSAYRRRFRTATGPLEPSVLFLEKGTSLLGHAGRLGMVLPDYLLLKNYPAIRRHLLERYAIEEITRWGRAFPEVQLDVCSIVARRHARPGGAHAVRCLPEGPGGTRHAIPQERFARTPGQVFNIVVGERSAALRERLLREGTPLGDLVETHEGIHTGNMRARLFLPPGRRGRVRGMEKLILGRSEIRPFSLCWSGWHVVYDPSRIRRDRGEYANLGRRRWFTEPKILVRRTGDHLIAALDREGLFASNNLFVALGREGIPVSLEYVEAYLNSALATWCFRSDQPRVGRIFAELKLMHLKRLPVPIPRVREHERRVVRIADRIRSGPAGEKGIGLQKELDLAFAELAGLEASERRRIEGDFASAPHSL